MDRWVDIDHPYEVIHIRFDQEKIRRINAQMARPLSTAQWEALEKAERRIHRGNPGCNGWTDVMMNDGDEFLNWMWSHTADYVEQDWRVNEARERGANQSVMDTMILHQTASRVAQALTIMTFGAEILING